MLKLVIFDMDGLMFDTEAVMCRAFLEVTRENGCPGTREQFMNLLGLNGRDIQNKYREYFGKDIDAGALYRLGGERKMSILKSEGIPVKKGLFELLRELDQLGLKKAVASSSDKEMIINNLRDAGILSSFDLVMSARGLKRGKPYPDIFLNVCRQLDVKPEDALVLEDSANGVEAAIAGGIPVIQIPDLLELEEELKRQCLAVKPSLYETIPLIRKLCQIDFYS